MKNSATVITSLASALPVVGTSIVGWLWGGFSVLYPWQLDCLNVQHLENFACCGNNFFMDGYIPRTPSLYLSFCPIGIVKIPFIYSQSADVWTVRFKSTGPASQRLHAKEQAWFVGFYKADGWFGVFKHGKDLQDAFGVEFNKKDEP